MLSNPPYGKSWKTDLERMGGKGGIRDPRFVIEHAGDPEYSLVTRSSDGQMLFLANLLSKMKHGTRLGSRIAEVHNGSSLFTGDAGQGESNIRRWIIENDWLEAIVALPLNMFYNTGIATYVWVLTNRKPEHRQGKVQLIDATAWFRPLRKNLGKKNCELSDGGYRPHRRDLHRASRRPTSRRSSTTRPSAIGRSRSNGRFARAGIDPDRAYSAEGDQGAEGGGRLVRRRAAGHPADPQARQGKADPLRGLFESGSAASRRRRYEPDSELRDTEPVPLLEPGGIEASSAAKCCRTRPTPG